LQPPDCNPCNDQFARRRQQRRQRPRVDLAKHTLGLFEGADQQQTPSLNIACMSRIQAIPVRFERRPRLVEGLRRPAEIARYEREFGLGDDAPHTRHRLSRTQQARGFLEHGFCPNEVVELRHRDAAQRQSRRVLPQPDALQGAKRVA
jgi:hypothetical protein